MKGSFYQIVFLLAVVSYLLPVLVVSAKRLWNQKCFWLFALYWMVLGIVNARKLLTEADPEILAMIGVVYNMLDVPIILGVFYFTTTSFKLKKFIKVGVPLYVVVELINTLFKGINHEAIKYMVGLGLIIILIVIVWEIILYLQEIEHTNVQKAMLFIYAGLLFQYGTYIIIYIFDYFIPNINRLDNYLLYYISSIIGNIIALIGFLIKKREHRSIPRNSLRFRNI